MLWGAFLYCKTFHRKKILIVFGVCVFSFFVLAGRLGYLMIFESPIISSWRKTFMSGSGVLKRPGAGSLTGMEPFWQITGLSARFLSYTVR